MSIWFDFENAPHVWVLKPIYDYFRRRGFICYCSARDFSYTVDFLRLAGIDADVQKVLTTKNKLIKVLNTLLRAYQLIKLYRCKNIHLAISHGSRSQILASKLLGIPIISMDDYEKSNQFFVKFTDTTLVPSVISKSHWGKYQNRIEHYPGLKENIYIKNCKRNNTILQKLNIDDNKVIVALRPEAETSHYYRKRANVLLSFIVEYLSAYNQKIEMLFMPRDEKQKTKIGRMLHGLGISYKIPSPSNFNFEITNLADLVIGGGGTMLRESAVFGVPAYSYFSGEWGAVDKYLLSIGRLVRISSEREIQKIKIVKCKKRTGLDSSTTLEHIVKILINHLHAQYGS